MYFIGSLDIFNQLMTVFNNWLVKFLEIYQAGVGGLQHSSSRCDIFVENSLKSSWSCPTLMVYRKVAEVLSKDLLFPHSSSKSQASSAAHRLLLNRHFLADRHKALCLSYKLSEVPALRPFKCSSQISLEGST